MCFVAWDISEIIEKKIKVECKIFFHNLLVFFKNNKQHYVYKTKKNRLKNHKMLPLDKLYIYDSLLVILCGSGYLSLIVGQEIGNLSIDSSSTTLDTDKNGPPSREMGIWHMNKVGITVV